MKIQKNKKEPEKISSIICRVVWDWIIQISLWSSIALLILIKSSKKEYAPFLHQLSLGFFGLMYIIYIINGIFISRTFKMLLSQKKSSNLESVLETLVQEKPELSFKVECYHFESNNLNADLGNTTIDEQKEIRTTTFAEKEIFEYYCSRDVSGPFSLNSDNIINNKYYYINLSLKFDIIFNDALTCYDYHRQKELFSNKYRWKDVHMDFIERKYLPGCISHKLYKIQNKVPFCVIWQTYIIFLVFGLVELFKLYVKSFVIQYTYTIRKIISTRENLNDSKYEYFDPMLILSDKEISFINFIYLNPNYKVKTNKDENEINNARQYECLIHSLNDLPKKEPVNEYHVSSFRQNSVECKETISDYYEKIIPDNY